LDAFLTQEFYRNLGTKFNIINIEEPPANKVLHKVQFCCINFAVRGMTQSWQAELRKYIRVTLVNP
jgi:3-oxoacyl-[acyl-carrier protein] reductase